MSPADAPATGPAGPERRRGTTHGRPPVRTAGQARAHLADLLGRLEGDFGRLLADAQLAVTELVVNAHRHGGGLTGFGARLDLERGCLVVDVEDGDERHPVGEPLDRRDPTAAGGRGWALVQILASTCHIDALPQGGKRIRVTFSLGRATAGRRSPSAGAET
ncbi:ATP-binding protein [Kitasatospora aureofaciens]|uniref:ATP-binding protein n=1 Tax=Kitasatospora aureofaciens TaxID=1894 RepID=A0A8H9I171_KITAU|nr:ATP-binding protein [Kitasatospora aureofaciens]GGV03049.1 ATP-binding protein [Kitasatospora aureofaciens]